MLLLRKVNGLRMRKKLFNDEKNHIFLGLLEYRESLFDMIFDCFY